MLGILKVGMSQRVPELRTQDNDLNSTGVPTPYEVEYYAFFDDAAASEKEAHRKLSDYHVKKEYFQAPLSTVIDTIESIVSCKVLFRRSPVEHRQTCDNYKDFLNDPKKLYEKRSIDHAHGSVAADTPIVALSEGPKWPYHEDDPGYDEEPTPDHENAELHPSVNSHNLLGGLPGPVQNHPARAAYTKPILTTALRGQSTVPRSTDKPRSLKEQIKAGSRAIARHHAARDLKRKSQTKSNIVPIREPGIHEL